MTAIFVSLCVSFLASLAAIKLIKPVAYRIGLVDIPNHRKRHTGEVPLIGGIAVFIGVLTSSAIAFSGSTLLNLYLISSALIVFIGILDDYKELTVSFRLIAQMLVSCIMVYGAGIHLASLGDLFGLGEVNLLWFGYPITVLAVIAAINAFNMSDGMDGLVGSVSLVAFLALAYLMVGSNATYSLLPVLLAFSTIPYLLFNLGVAGGQAKKIFMGDAGSMFVGLSVVWLLVIGSQGSEQAFKPVTALWLIAVPFIDMCSLTVRRLMRGHSPIRPARDHLHHICLHYGLSHKASLTLIVGLAIAMAILGIVLERSNVPEWGMFSMYLLVMFVYHLVMCRLEKSINVFELNNR